LDLVASEGRVSAASWLLWLSTRPVAERLVPAPINIPKINLSLDQPSNQARLPSSSYGATGSEHKRPRAAGAVLFVPVVMIHASGFMVLKSA
jgi:hypothetical protein